MKILFKFLLVSLLLGIAYSCSDDKEDDGGEKPKVKLLPVKIIKNSFQEHTVTKDVTYTFKYNEKNQLTQIDTNDGDLYTFYYNNNGILIQFAKDGKNISSKNEYNISYDKEIVTIEDRTSFKINASECLTNYELQYEGGYHKSTKEYAYDNHSNLIKEIHTSTSPDEKDIFTTTYQYSTFYSPFANLSLPPWLLLSTNKYSDYEHEFLNLPFHNIVGTHLPQKTNFEGVFYKNDELIEVDLPYEEYSTILVLSNENNYPTNFKIVGADFKNDRYNYEYTVIYKEIK